MRARGVNSPNCPGRLPDRAFWTTFRCPRAANSTEFDPESGVVHQFRGDRLCDGPSRGSKNRPNSRNQHHDSTMKSERTSIGTESSSDCGGGHEATGRSGRSAPTIGSRTSLATSASSSGRRRPPAPYRERPASDAARPVSRARDSLVLRGAGQPARRTRSAGASTWIPRNGFRTRRSLSPGDDEPGVRVHSEFQDGVVLGITAGADAFLDLDHAGTGDERRHEFHPVREASDGDRTRGGAGRRQRR